MGALHQLSRDRGSALVRVRQSFPGASDYSATRGAVRKVLGQSPGGPVEHCRAQDIERPLDIRGGDVGFGSACCAGSCCCAFHYGWHLTERHDFTDVEALVIYSALDDGLQVVHFVLTEAGERVVRTLIQSRMF